MKNGNRLGIAGIATLISGIVVVLVPTADTRITTLGSCIEVVAYLMFIVAAFLRPLKWLAVLALIPASAYLWLLSLGH
jgi:hypothetical protein